MDEVIRDVYAESSHDPMEAKMRTILMFLWRAGISLYCLTPQKWSTLWERR